MSGVVNSVAYAHGRKLADVPIADVSEALAKQADSFVWIGLHEPDGPLLRQVQQEFELHDLAIEDALVAHQRPKLERYGAGIFVVLRTARCVDRGIEFGETDIFAGPRYVVSVRHGASSLSYADVRARCEATPGLLGKGPAFVLYALMDFVVDQYFPIVDTLEGELEALEEDVFGQKFDRETTTRIYRLQRGLVDVKRAISPLIDVCNRLTRWDNDLIPDDVRAYFRDVYDHVIRINELVDTLRELLTTALEANLSLIAVSQNEDMKRLAGWAAIIAVPTMIAGIYGMNFRFMPELEWRWAYPTVMVVMLGLCGFLYYKFKESGWL